MAARWFNRAMSEQERQATLASGRPSYAHASKFFSPDLGWIATRVRDGSFRGGEARPGDYARVLAFEVEVASMSLFRRLNATELSLSRRDAQFLEAAISDVPENLVAAAALRRAHGSSRATASRSRPWAGSRATTCGRGRRRRRPASRRAR